MSASERPSDVGGPRPENQRKRTELQKPRRSLIGTLVVVAIGAIAFIAMRRSEQLGLPAGYLTGSSATVAAVVIAGAHALAAVLLAVRFVRARHVAAVAASLLVVSSVTLIVLMLGVVWVPAVLFFIGFVELLLVAAATPRKPAHRKHVPGR
jgi:hypothetical protein